MVNFACRNLICAILFLAGLSMGWAQVTTTSSISGTVKDSSGGAIPGAEVTVEKTDTGAVFKALTDDRGLYTVPLLGAGVYKITVGVPGFKTAVITDVKLDAGVPATRNVTMEVGQISEQVTVLGGAEVLQTQSTTVATTIQGRQIIELPFVSRDALDLIMFLPGASTPGRPRTTSVQGLPKGALNITMDGVNVQDNVLKSSDGFFTYIRPRIDAIDEVTLSTNNPGSESAAEGAIQIKFVTRSGSNGFRGSVYEYFRNTALNSNYYFNNIAGLPRQVLQLNQYGARVGGPILKNKAFFFVNYEEFRLPESLTRQRTILSPEALDGTFNYPGGPAGGVNVLDLARNNGYVGAKDPITSKILDEIQGSTKLGSVETLTNTPYLKRFSFTNKGSQTRRFGTVRFDLNLTEKHHIENIWNYDDFASVVDFLNGTDPRFPSGSASKIFGSQGSDRFSNVIAYRTTIGPRMVNEARLGLVGGTVVFFPEVGPSLFDPFGGANLGFPLVTGPAALSGNSRRNAPLWQFTNNLHWTKGNHNWNLGMSFTHVAWWNSANGGSMVPTVSFGLNTLDPASRLFSTANFPGGANFVGAAGSLYALLTALVSSASRTAFLDENTKTYGLGINSVQRNRQREFGVYAQDSWKLTPNFTFNYGLRWEVQFPFVHTNEVYAKTTLAALYGTSGLNQLFKPGAKGGSVPMFDAVTAKDRPYNVDFNNLAPTVGFAWTPAFDNAFLRRIFGESGKSVIRGGYSIAFNRDGLNNASTMLGANPGRAIGLTNSVATGTLATQTYYRNSGVPSFAVPAPPKYPFATRDIDSVNAYDPNLRMGYIQSWNFSVQRELTRDMTLELRYVANRGTKLWRQIALNEVNIFESGFLKEFQQAQKNLDINRANGRGSNFRNNGLAGQASLPIYEASFGSATSSLFSNATFVNQVTFGTAGAAANSLAFNRTYHNNRVRAGNAPNLFVVNPDNLFGNSFLFTNGSASKYDAFVLEVRRRMSRGLLVQGSYEFAQGRNNTYASSSVSFSGYRTLRDTALNWGPSPWDLRHAFKANWIWEMPFGAGHAWSSDNRVLNKLMEGWALHGTTRINAGRPSLLTSGRATYNQNDGGVVLTGLDVNQLQDRLSVRKENGRVYLFPQDTIDNTIKSMGLIPGTPAGQYIAPASTPGQFGGHVFLSGPSFARADLSIVKRTFINETTNVEFRAEFLNAFNNINFFIGSPASDVTSFSINSTLFGQTTSAYQDLSTTNDPGGRMIQFVLRVNF